MNEKLAGLSALLGTKVTIEGLPESRENPLAYHEALAALGKRGCVIIVVPDGLHFATAKAAMERRLPVMVKKPLTPTLAEAQELVRLSQEPGAYGVVDFHKRWDLPNLKLREMIRAGSERPYTPLWNTASGAWSRRRFS